MSSSPRILSAPASAGEKSLAAREAAHRSWAMTENRSTRTAPARAALAAKFLAEAGGDPVRAEHLRKAHFLRLARMSAQARRRSGDLARQADAADAELSEVGGGFDAA